MVDYLTEKEINCLNDSQKKIYNSFGRKSALKKYNKLCVLEHICPICGLDLDSNNYCNRCYSQFSIVGKKISG